MQSPVLVVSDIHFHTYKAHSKLIDGVNSRLLQQIAAWKQAVALGLEHGCGLMLVCGDVFEVRGNIRPTVFNPVSALIVEALSSGLSIAVIPGNHDMENLGVGESSVDSWRYLRGSHRGRRKRCLVFREPSLHRIGGRKILGIPYMHDPSEFKETFASLSARFKPDITMIHQGVDNFNRNGEYPATGITAEWLEANNPGLTVVGHYHRPGMSESGRVLNAGALTQHRFSDEGSERGCWVLDGSKAQFIPIEGPKFITLGKDVPTGPECHGAFVRIRSKTQKDAESIRKKVEAAGALSVSVQIEREFKTSHEKTIAISTPRTMMSEYLDLVEKYHGRKDAIMDLFDKVCLAQ